jgi:aspartyl-tRNA(Asn)/glutamyl-tRNA(Gln) amidotransferase subunit B
LLPHVDDVLEEFAGKVEEYRAGNPNLLGLFIGQVMRRTGGTADPQAVRELLLEKLGPAGGHP